MKNKILKNPILILLRGKEGEWLGSGGSQPSFSRKWNTGNLNETEKSSKMRNLHRRTLVAFSGGLSCLLLYVNSKNILKRNFESFWRTTVLSKYFSKNQVLSQKTFEAFIVNPDPVNAVLYLNAFTIIQNFPQSTKKHLLKLYSQEVLKN